MKYRIFYIIFFSLIFSFCPASSQFLWKLNQESWADSRYKNLEEFDEPSLVSEALHIIQYNLQEKSANEVLNQASKFVPEISEFIKLRESGEPDSLFSVNRRTLHAISNYFGKKMPGSINHLYARLTEAIANGNVSHNESEWDSLIKDISTKIKNNDSTELRTLLSLAKINKFLIGGTYKPMLTEEDYALIPLLENEALQAFPKGDFPQSIMCVELLNNLGILKYSIDDEFLAWLLNGEDGKNFKNNCYFIGATRMYPSNSDYYFSKAQEIANKILNDGHPLVRNLSSQYIIFQKSVGGLNPSLYEQSAKEYQFNSMYYPASSIEVAMSKVLFVLDALSMGELRPETQNLDVTMDIIRDYLGKDNFLYLKYLKTLGAALPLYGVNEDYWTQRLEADLREAGIGKEDDEMLLVSFDINAAKFGESAEVPLQNIYNLESIYRSTHSSDPQSLELGRLLANFFSNSAGDHKRAASVMEIAFNDLNKKLGKDAINHPIWSKFFIERANIKSNDHDAAQTDKDYALLVDQIDKMNTPYRDKLKWQVVRYWIDHRINQTNDFPGAIELIQQYEELPAKVEPYGSFLLKANQAFLLSSQQDSRRKAKPYAMEALRLAKECFANNDSLRIIYPSFTPLVSAFINVNDIDHAIEAAEMQADLYKLDSGELFTLDYFNQAITRANLYNKANRKSEANRLMATCMQQLKSSPEFSASPYLVDCLWEDYYMAKNQNLGDLYNYMYKLPDLLNYTNQIINLSNHDQDIVYNYGARLWTELLYMVSNSFAFMQEAQKSDSSIPQAKIDEFKNLFDINNILDSSLFIYNEFKSYDPKYLTNPIFQQLALSLAYYYRVVEHNPEEAMKCYLQLMEGDLDTISKILLVNDVAFFALESQNFPLLKTSLETLELALQLEPVFAKDSYFNFDELKAFYLMAVEKDYESALKYAKDYFNRSKEVLDGNFRLMTTNEQNNFMEANGDPAKILCSLLQYSPDKIAAEVYDAVLYRTGMQLRSQRDIKEALSNSTNPRIIELIDTIETLKKNIDTFRFDNSLDPYNPQTIQQGAEKAELHRQLNFAEGKLLQLAAPMLPPLPEDVKWHQVAHALQSDEAAIEFIFSDSDIMALVLKRDAIAPVAINMVPQQQLFDLLTGLNKKNSSALATALYASKADSLYQMLWQPLEEQLKGITKVYYTAPGILNNLAFNAFTDPSGTPLFDRYDLNQLTTTSQLVFDHPKSKLESIAMMGNILYAENQTPSPKSDAKKRNFEEDFDFSDESDNNPAGSRSVAKTYFRHLPFTEDEINSISLLFANDKVAGSQLHNATEEKFREIVATPHDILHLATHGFYINSGDEASKIPFYKDKSTTSMNRSGFALAGAETAWRGLTDQKDNNDGIVTAQEVALLNLDSTELVVLSACETALGDYSYEGIYGLQRGFKQAGVKSMLVSLWSVNDESTSLFMETFYKSLKNGSNLQEAWRKAVDKVRSAYSDPYYWAPFVLLDAI